MSSTENERYLLVPTADGSYTLLDACMNDHFHSLNGALTESRYVYIEHGLEYFIKKYSGIKEIQVLEFGYGTGMNAILSFLFSKKYKDISFNYISMEKYLLPQTITKSYISMHPQLNYNGEWIEMDEALKHRGYWYAENFSITLLEHDFMDLNKITINPVQVLFWDAFAPSRHADAWNENQVNNVLSVLGIPSVVSTFCAQGQFKRLLMKYGFQVWNPKGPPGKKEITVAERL